MLKSGKTRWAIINGEIVEVGQTVAKATVVKILHESVEMELNGQRFLLYIGGATPPTGPAAGSTSPREGG